MTDKEEGNVENQALPHNQSLSENSTLVNISTERTISDYAIINILSLCV